MNMRSAALVAAMLAVQPAGAQTLTIAEARTLPAEEVAQRILGAVGTLYTEVERPGSRAGLLAPGDLPIGLTSLRLASAPRLSRFDGLCEANVVYVSFQTVRRASEEDPDPPARVRVMRTAMLYRIADPTGPDAAGTAAGDRPGADQCDASGPVLAGDARTRRYFGGTAFGVSAFEPHHAAFAARALAQARSGVRAGSVRTDCRLDPGFGPGELCADPARLVDGLDTGPARSFDVDWCERARARARLCVTAHFRMPYSTSHSADEVTILIETDATAIDPWAQAIGIRSVIVFGQSWVV
jgi:hypothetical protein